MEDSLRSIFTEEVVDVLSVKSIEDHICPYCLKKLSNKKGVRLHISKVHREISQSMKDLKNKPKEMLNRPEPLKIGKNNSNSIESSQNIDVQSNESLNEISLLCEELSILKSSIPVLKRLPKAARSLIAEELSNIIFFCIRSNSFNNWRLLFIFPYFVFRAPAKNKTKKKDENISLDTYVK